MLEKYQKRPIGALFTTHPLEELDEDLSDDGVDELDAILGSETDLTSEDILSSCKMKT
ncbi:hypothetical protein MUCCIDRAFT_116332 [Mucor lusitanicus CBS 277.49]|uniref:Uncharacterized protein n=1 Tax=Mucor lusitanicus CBS 277.49 TaxID=747725 RepID=A0A162Y5P0_MUCCL|nr:hypothetical protein MUCCIDRAFT_116332 [Mucor lusitanicus CBS 277.49]